MNMALWQPRVQRQQLNALFIFLFFLIPRSARFHKNDFIRMIAFAKFKQKSLGKIQKTPAIALAHLTFQMFSWLCSTLEAEELILSLQPH